MVSKNFEGEKGIQEKIHLLTSRLEKQLDVLKSAHVQELDFLKQTFHAGIEHLHVDFEKRWGEFNERHIRCTLELEQEILYLKELIDSQRLMMESQLLYIRELEEQAQVYHNSGKLT